MQLQGLKMPKKLMTYKKIKPKMMVGGIKLKKRPYSIMENRAVTSGKPSPIMGTSKGIKAKGSKVTKMDASKGAKFKVKRKPKTTSSFGVVRSQSISRTEGHIGEIKMKLTPKQKTRKQAIIRRTNSMLNRVNKGAHLGYAGIRKAEGLALRVK